MTIDEALAFADEWAQGQTFHAGSQGWRVVCLLLAEEVRRLRHAPAQDTVNQCDGCASNMRIEDGIHYNKDGRPHVACTAARYSEPVQSGCATQDAVRVPKAALAWLLGEEGEFVPPADQRLFRGKLPTYWWRTEFQRRIEAAAPCADEAVRMTTITPRDPVEVTRAQANAYFAAMKLLGLEPHEYLPDAIRRLQSAYESAVRGRADFRDALRAERAAPPAAPKGDEAREAERWRALIGCARIRMFGWAGLDADGVPPAESDGYVHFGAEFWTHYPEQVDTSTAAAVITAFADAAIAAGRRER
jgi:hypothetical protein